MLTRICEPSEYLHLITQDGSINQRTGYLMVSTTRRGGPKGKKCKFAKHRLILLDKIGPGEHPCFHCRKVVSWDELLHDNPDRALVCDHLDFNKLNNDPANLVPSCNMCNSTRADEQKALTVELGGEAVSFASLALKRGMTIGGFKSRIKAGMSVEAAADLPRTKQWGNIEYNGETLSLQEWSERAGIASGTLFGRLSGGWSVEQALTAPLGTCPHSASGRPRKDELLTAGGETLPVSAWSERLAVPVATIRTRIRKGWPVARALTPIAQEETITYNGETLTLTEWAQRTGLSFIAIKRRIQRGWEAEKIITTPCDTTKNEGRLVSLNGETHSLAEWSRRTGIPVSTIKNRLKSGWPVADVFNTPHAA